MHCTVHVSNRCSQDRFIAGFNDQKNLQGKWGRVAPGITYSFFPDKSVMYGLDPKKERKNPNILYLTIALHSKINQYSNKV